MTGVDDTGQTIGRSPAGGLHGPRVGYAFAAACGAASAATCLLGLRRLRSPNPP